MTKPASIEALPEPAIVQPAALEPVLESEPAIVESEPVIEPVMQVKLRLVPKNVPKNVTPKHEVPSTLERGEKICIDCGLPYPLDAFYTKNATKDGRQSRCRECDKKRRTEYNQGLHVKASEQDDRERDAARKRASEATVSAGKSPPYVYKGISGGFLIYGYVK